MQAADTNVWARAYLNDDARQAKQARTAIATACAAEGIFIPLLVLAELFWVLAGAWEKERVLDTLGAHLQHQRSRCRIPCACRTGVEGISRSGGAGFADRLIVEVAFAEGVREILTFDKALARQPRVRRLH